MLNVGVAKVADQYFQVRVPWLPKMGNISLEGLHKVLLLMRLKGAWAALSHCCNGVFSSVLAQEDQAACNGQSTTTQHFSG